MEGQETWSPRRMILLVLQKMCNMIDKEDENMAQRVTSFLVGPADVLLQIADHRD